MKLAFDLGVNSLEPFSKMLLYLGLLLRSRYLFNFGSSTLDLALFEMILALSAPIGLIP